MKKTVIIGASPNPNRYAHKAAYRLVKYGHEIVPMGIRTGELAGVKILRIQAQPDIEDVDTITLYIAPRHQPQYYDYLMKLHPKRLIFNPGTENPEFMKICESWGVEVIEGCTLVMLGAGSF